MDGAPQWLGIVIQLGSFGLVAWLFFHVFKNTLPEMVKKFAEQLDHQWESYQKDLEVQRTLLREERQAMQEEVKAIRTATIELARSINKLTITTLYHDATSKGVSPQTLGSPDELLKLIQDRFSP